MNHPLAIAIQELIGQLHVTSSNLPGKKLLGLPVIGTCL